MPYAHVNGIKMYYEIHGTGNPLVMVQGFTRNTLGFSKLADCLKDQYQVILFDNRGSGRSQHPSPPYSIEMMTKDLALLLETLKIEKAYFFGHSMGGAIVEQYCINYPLQIEKAIICSSFAKVPYNALMQIDTIAEMALAGVPQEFIFQTVLPWLFSSKYLEQKNAPENIIKKMMNDPFPQKPEGYMGQGEALKHFDISNQLESIEAPCLIIVGEDDLYTPVSCSKVISEKIKKAQLKIIPQQGHMICEEIPEMLCNEIKAFLRN